MYVVLGLKKQSTNHVHTSGVVLYIHQDSQYIQGTTKYWCTGNLSAQLATYFYTEQSMP